MSRFPRLPARTGSGLALAGTLLLALAARPAAAGPPEAAGLPWGDILVDSAGADRARSGDPSANGADDDASRRPGLFLHPVPGMRLGAEAAIDRRGGGPRAMVALKLDF